MKERGIPFSGAMVRAILAGTKTQTRRQLYTLTKLTNQATYDRRYPPPPPQHGPGEGWTLSQWASAKPGDRLWVREGWRTEAVLDPLPPRLLGGGAPISYEATPNGAMSSPGRRRPGMFLPRVFSRITLEIQSTRVERLQDITEADGKAEGAPCVDEFSGREVLFPEHSKAGSYRLGYWCLWDSLNGDSQPSHENPWVVVLTFKRAPT